MGLIKFPQIEVFPQQKKKKYTPSKIYPNWRPSYLRQQIHKFIYSHLDTLTILFLFSFLSILSSPFLSLRYCQCRYAIIDVVSYRLAQLYRMIWLSLLCHYWIVVAVVVESVVTAVESSMSALQLNGKIIMRDNN